MNEQLFSGKELHRFMGEHREKANANVRMLKNKDFENKSIENLVESICKDALLEVPTLDMNEENWKKKTRNIGVGRDVADYSIPFSGDGIFFGIRPPNTFEYRFHEIEEGKLQQLEADIGAEYCTFSLLIDDDTKTRLKDALETINSCLGVQRREYGEFRTGLKKEIQDQVIGLKKRIEDTERKKRGLGL